MEQKLLKREKIRGLVKGVVVGNDLAVVNYRGWDWDWDWD